MNDEPPVSTADHSRRSLEVRLPARPQLRARLHQILDTLDHLDLREPTCLNLPENGSRRSRWRKMVRSKTSKIFLK